MPAVGAPQKSGSLIFTCQNKCFAWLCQPWGSICMANITCELKSSHSKKFWEALYLDGGWYSTNPIRDGSWSCLSSSTPSTAFVSLAENWVATIGEQGNLTAP